MAYTGLVKMYQRTVEKIRYQLEVRLYPCADFLKMVINHYAGHPPYGLEWMVGILTGSCPFVSNLSRLHRYKINNRSQVRTGLTMSQPDQFK